MDSNIASYVALKMLEEAGVKLLLSIYVADPIMEGNVVKRVFVENKSGRQAVKAKVVVDATGNASVAARAGAPMIVEVPVDPNWSSIISKERSMERFPL